MSDPLEEKYRVLNASLSADVVPTPRQLKEIMKLLKGKNLSEIWDPHLHRPDGAVCPILRDVHGNLEQIGSGVLLGIGEHRFLLTAAHVLDERHRYPMMAPGTKGFVGITGQLISSNIPKSGSRMDDRYDIACVRLNDRFLKRLHGNLAFLNEDDIDAFDETAKNDVYTIVGYPSRKSETHDKTVSTPIFHISGDGVADRRYESLQCKPSHHILIQFRKSRAVNYATMYRSQIPHPEGISGGGVFAWDKRLPELSALKQPKLVGIVTEYHPQLNVFVATRLGCYLAMMHRNDPLLPIAGAPRKADS